MHDSWKKSSRRLPGGNPRRGTNDNSKRGAGGGAIASGNSNAGKPHGIARVISKRGFCSRSQAEALVREGRVSLRRKIVTNPEAPTFEDDEIRVDGAPVIANKFIYFMMNKPRGYVTTANDEKGRATVMDLFREEYAKMFPGKPVPHISPVGRLDAASEGLLLFTNDTEWANGLLETGERNFVATDERREIGNERLETNESKQWLVVGKQGRSDGGTKRPKHTKTYRVQVASHPTAEHLAQMEAGFKVPPRVFGAPEEFMHAVSAKLHSAGEKNCWLEIVLDEGKNREIRRMLAHLGYEVLRLVRIKFCGYELGNLKPGEIRVLPQIREIT